MRRKLAVRMVGGSSFSLCEADLVEPDGIEPTTS
jgi:hypothetical protein